MSEVEVDVQTEEKPKRGRGRPRVARPLNFKRGGPEAMKKQIISVSATVPAPSHTNFLEEKAKGFFDYWHSLTKDQADRCTVKIYRLWPVIDMKIGGKTSGEIARIDGPNPYDSERFKEEVLHQHGSGDYRFILQENGVTGLITQCFLKVRDMEFHPPRIDPRTLLLSDPQNASFIEGKGNAVNVSQETPGYTDPQKKEEEDDMQTAAVTALTDAVVNLSERASNGQNHGSDVGVTAAREAIHIMGEASKNAMEQVRRTHEELTHSNAQGQNPVEMMAALSGVVRDLMPKQDNSGFRDILAIQQANHDAMLKMVMTQMDYHKKEAESLKASVTVAKPEKSIVEQFTEAKELMELFGGSVGGGNSRRDEEDHSPNPAEPSVTRMLLENAPVIVQGVIGFGL